MNHAYRKATHKLRLKLYGKILKSRALTSAFSRKWIMRSGVAHIPLAKSESHPPAKAKREKSRSMAMTLWRVFLRD